MKIYFHASVSQKNKYGQYYERIYNQLVKLNYEVDAEHVFNHTINFLDARDRAEDIHKDYRLLMNRIDKADLVVFEISFPSTIVCGHALTRALERGKPVLGLYHEDTTPALLRGLETERFLIAGYNTDNLERVVSDRVKEIATLPDQRFTMLLPRDIVGYLEKLAEQGINRSEYLRKLIRKEMREE